MWMGMRWWRGKWAPRQSGWPAAHRRCQMREITPVHSIQSIYVYIPSFRLLPPFSSFIFAFSPTYLSKSTYLPPCLYLSFLFILLLFVQIILGVFRVITLFPPPTNPLLFIHLFMMHLFHAFAPTITENLNF